MFCSTVIPTVNRPTLFQAVHSVLDQDFAAHDFEVIVVNDSGQQLPGTDWQRSARVRVIHTDRRERSTARNAGAAVARGKYLHFLDDDDWMLPGALEHFWELSQTSQAAWLYGGYRLVDLNKKVLRECYPDESGNCFVRFIAGEWLPLQASLIESQVFFALGGFAPLTSLLGGDEDVDLTRQFSLHHDIAGSPSPVVVIRVGLESSTTNYTNLHQQSRKSREKALGAPGAFVRLRASALERKVASGYWQGRIVWFYLTSVLWNLQNKKPLTAASRLVFGITSLLLAGRHVLSERFWRGAIKPHITRGWLSIHV